MKTMASNGSAVTVTKVRTHGTDGTFRGVVTRVVFADGFSVDFIGTMPKGVAVKQAEDYRVREAARGTAVAS